MSVERGDRAINWLQAGGQHYARFRPEYPPASAAFLAAASPDTCFAVDVGCGSGQLAAQLDEELDERFAHFYRNEIGPFWPPERQLVDRGYADLDFPLAEFPPPAMAMRKVWSLAELIGYPSTWSAVKHAVKQGHGRAIEGFATDLAARWGDPEARRPVTWPINMRTGIV
jgi:hypothetical protein